MSATELRLSGAPQAAPAHRALPVRRPTNATLVVLGVTGVITTISLLITHAIAYDPECWIVWGREAFGAGVVSTWDGPSWKPLPIMLIAPFTLISRGEADVYYWLAIARAGALLGVFGVAVITSRLAGKTAGVIAALLIVVSAWWSYNGVLGNAEPPVVGLIAGAVLAHDRGWIPVAGALAWAVCLTRPEACPFALAYAAWLMWQRRSQTRAPRIIAGTTAAGAVTVILAWAVPILFNTGGNAVRAATSSASSGSASYASVPFLATFREAFSELTVLPGVLAAIGILMAAWSFRHTWQRGNLPDSLASVPRELMIGLAALVYVAIVGVMAQIGFTGNARYLIPALAGFDIVAAISAVRLATFVGPRLRVSAPRLQAGTVAVLITASALLAGLHSLRIERSSVSGHAMIASTMRKQLVGFHCAGHIVTYSANNSTLAQILGQSLAQSTITSKIRPRLGRFIYCARTPAAS